MTYTTLTYNGTEQSVGDWGFERGSFRTVLNNRAPSVAVGFIPGEDRNSTPTFPFEGQVTIQRERVYNPTTGLYTGGYIDLIAKRIGRSVTDAPGNKGASYEFQDWWYDAARTLYQQLTKAYNTVLANLGVQLTTDLLLFSKISDGHAVDPDEPLNQLPGFLIATTNGKQIRAILQFMLDQNAAQGLPVLFQIGDIDPALPLNSYPARSMFCDQAIEKCLELAPNTTCETDYSTTPPTVNFLSRASLVPVTLALANGTDHQSISLNHREEDKLRAVLVLYRFNNTIDGATYFTYGKDKYGPNGFNHASDPEGGLRVHVEVIDLAGYQATTVRATLDVRAVISSAATQDQRRSWWAQHKPEFKSSKLRNMTITDITITEVQPNDDDDTPDDYTVTGPTVLLANYPNQVLSGSVHSWMRLSGGANVVAKKCVLKAEYTCDEYDVEGAAGATKFTTATNGQLLKPKVKRQLSVTLNLTNGVSGEYSSLTSQTFAETPPNGIAQQIYEAFNATRWEGENVTVKVPLSNAVRLGNALNLSNGRAELATMNAMVRSVTKTDADGTATVSFGPPRVAGTGDMVALSMFARFRRVFENPNVRATGLAADGGGVTL